jgi:hypothetical protein
VKGYSAGRKIRKAIYALAPESVFAGISSQNARLVRDITESASPSHIGRQNTPRGKSFDSSIQVKTDILNLCQIISMSGKPLTDCGTEKILSLAAETQFAPNGEKRHICSLNGN